MGDIHEIKKNAQVKAILAFTIDHLPLYVHHLCHCSKT